MASNRVLALVAAITLSGGAMAADDAATDATSLFKRRAQDITELSTLDLDRQVAQKRRELQGPAPSEHKDDATPEKKKPVPVRLHEIGGSDSHMVATFRLSDGRLADFTPGQRVPGFGTIRAIHEKAVEDDKGHFYRPEDPTE
ncbi:MAG TPA: type IV pilus biogenesis protein PilP [Rhizomicrobium sp.]|nr:type IV pilus biogenesis protein PilP [Rhizomicrobium sp.]